MSNTISVVSGKGGCGKSLLTAVLGSALAREGAKVIMIDMDIFVRGLTVLIHNFRKRYSNQNTITVSDIFGVYANNSKTKDPRFFDVENLSVERFFECDVLPAVSNIGDPLDYNDKDLSDQDFCNTQITKLLSEVSKKYDYILLDNRAGMDSLVFASCYNSDFVLTVAEDDDVGKQTNINLVNFLKYNKNIKNIYTIINKTRKIHDYTELRKRVETRADYSTIGFIPFDIEIMEDFGLDRFWNSVTETLYFKALIDSWNNLAQTQKVIEIVEKRYKFPPKIFMSNQQGKFALIERMLRIYSIIFLLTGGVVYAYGKLRFEYLTALDLVSFISTAIGVIALVLSTSNFRRFLLGSKNKV